MSATASALPVLRDDLSLHPGPAAADGSPTWTIRDPVRNRFFRISWPMFEVLSRWSLGSAPAVAAAINAETTLHLDPEDIDDMVSFLAGNQLVQVLSHAQTARLAGQAEAARQSWHQWLLHHYLFFRIPLVRPDRWLSATLPWVRWLGAGWFRAATLVALVLGLGLLQRQWDQFTGALVDTLTLEGLAAYGVALIGVKIVHELAHAYTAKHHGCRVPAIGVAFLVLWPLLYTDVNEAWLLPGRRQRLQVGAAGILSELTVAAWATLAWTFLPDGPARDGALVLATLTWISSLAINLSPFMRFDGYFLLMDGLEMPNLHPRAFAIARWHLRETLFGLGLPPPEPFAPGRRRALVLFAYAVWIYRLLLFLGIAVLVYHFFIKAVGVLLFAVEIVWFVLRPFWSEATIWFSLRREILARRRLWFTLAGLTAVVGLAAVPWQSRITAPAVLKAVPATELYLPLPARLEAVLVRGGEAVVAGQPLMRFAAPDLAHRRAMLAARLDGLAAQIDYAILDPATRERLGVLRQEQARARAEEAALDAEQARLTLTAPIAGTVVDLLPDLAPGDWLSPRQRLGVVRADSVAAVAYIAEADLPRVPEGAGARFIAADPGVPIVAGRLVRLDPGPARDLGDEMLASIHGGPLAARVAQDRVIPESPVTRGHVALAVAPPAHELPGTVSLDGERRSLLDRLWRAAAVVFLREWGA